MSRSRSSATVLAFAAFLGSACAPTHASPASAVSRARSAVCAPGAHELLETRALDAVASGLSNGDSLHSALGRLPARPEFATSMHLVGVVDDRGIATAVAGHFCRDLQDRRLREIGVARTGHELFIVVIAPLDVPAPGSDSAVAREVLARVNAARAAGRRCGSTSFAPARPLVLASRLSAVAREHSIDMAPTAGIDHRGRDGSSPSERVSRSGYVAQMVGENVAGGVPTAAEVVAGWLDSPGHCANIMEPRFTEMGLGFVVVPTSRLQIYWTQLFALPAHAATTSRAL